MKTLFVALFAIGCGGGGGGMPVQDAPHVDAPHADASHVFMDGPPGTTPLTVKNIDSWCAVTVNGAALTGTVVNVTPGAITVTAAGAGTFITGPHPWYHTDGDTGTGDPGMSSGGGTQPTNTATVTVGTTPKCIYACCPFSNGTGCDVGGMFIPTDPCL